MLHGLLVHRRHVAALICVARNCLVGARAARSARCFARMLECLGASSPPTYPAIRSSRTVIHTPAPSSADRPAAGNNRPARAGRAEAASSAPGRGPLPTDRSPLNEEWRAHAQRDVERRHEPEVQPVRPFECETLTDGAADRVRWDEDPLARVTWSRQSAASCWTNGFIDVSAETHGRSKWCDAHSDDTQDCKPANESWPTDKLFRTGHFRTLTYAGP